MLTLNVTDVRKEWSTVIDNTIREKPQFIRRTRDYMMLADIEFLEILLESYKFTANKLIEKDKSITLVLNEIDLIVNAKTEEEAKTKLAEEILEYAEDFYNEFNVWSIAPNRKAHIPYVFKVLILDDIKKIEELISCQNGKN